ncbi:MAG: NYN domain-containing protein, partial [Clostridiales bacterium]|nr:NYN domain-containing protein [Clostridiales bacterium]
MQKVVAFLDCANLSEAARDLCLKANHGHLLKNYLALNEEGRFLQAAYAYVPIDPRKEHASDSAIEELWPAGYAVKSKLGAISAHAYKCNFDVEITMDIVKAIYDVKHDIAAIVSGDSDYAPLAMQLREMGICVETAAFRSSMSRQLPQRASGYICLDSYCTD